MDRRQHRRFDLSAPVTYAWRKKGEGRRTADGITRDVSEMGLFVVTDSPPPLGSVVRFEVSFVFRDNSQVQMRARGKVLRVETDKKANSDQGFAARTKTLWFSNRGALKMQASE